MSHPITGRVRGSGRNIRDQSWKEACAGSSKPSKPRDSGRHPITRRPHKSRAKRLGKSVGVKPSGAKCANKHDQSGLLRFYKSVKKRLAKFGKKTYPEQSTKKNSDQPAQKKDEKL